MNETHNRAEPPVGDGRITSHPPADDSAAWHELPLIIDQLTSGEPELMAVVATRAELLSRRHPRWFDAYEATLVCLATIATNCHAKEALIEIIKRTAIAPCRQADAAMLCLECVTPK